MKNFIFSILFFGISFTLFGQNTFNRVEDYYDTNRTAANYFRSLCSFDGSYYGAVRIYNQGTQYLGLVKLNNNGSIVKKSLKESPKGDIVVYPNQTLITTSDSNIMICANLVDTAWDGYLIKINTNLDTLWTKVYDLPANLAGCSTGTNARNFFTAIKETPDKGFIITGNFHKYCVNDMANQRAFLLKVDSLGNVEWWKAYNDVADLFDIELTTQGNYIFINKWNGMNIMEVDSIGILVWRKTLNYWPGQANAGDLTYYGNNKYIVAAPYLYDIQNNKAKIKAMMIDISTQQIVWDTTYFLFHSVNSISLNQVMGVEVDQNGDIIIWAPAHVVESKGTRGAILKLNSQGDSLWAKYIVTDSITLLWDDLQLNDLIITDDGGFMGVGYQLFGDDGSVMAWLFKTDSNGTIGWQASIPISQQQFKIWPNPANDYVNIELNKSLIKSAQLSVYSSIGQMVLQKELNKGEENIRLNIEKLKSGVYFIEVRNTDGVIGVGKLIKQ